MQASGAEHRTFCFWGGRYVTPEPFPELIAAAAKDPDSVGEYSKLKAEKLWWV